MNYIDIKDREFGKWTTLAYKGRGLWECQCACGSPPRLVYVSALLRGRSRSCGCVRAEREAVVRSVFVRQHKALYRIWLRIVRSENVCERWRSFENFYTDAGDPPASPDGSRRERK